MENGESEIPMQLKRAKATKTAFGLFIDWLFHIIGGATY